jgi:MoxR-like ATPase
VLTSNRTREVHDALKRRCLYHWVEHPELAREVEIILQRVPGAAQLIARDVALIVRRLREMGLVKPPGVAESIDWAQALLMVGARRLDGEAAAATLGAVVKYREDQLRVRREVLPALEELLRQ